MLIELPIAMAARNGVFFLPVLILIGVIAVVAVILLALRPKGQPVPPPPLDDQERNKRYREIRDKLHEERSRILDMVVNGQISADEGDRLLDAIERETSTMACPFCDADIRIEAIKCKFCGRFLVDNHPHGGPRRLYLSRQPVISGVCGGVADYLQMDPALVRILTIVVALFTSGLPILIAYIIAACIVPKQPT